MNCVPLQQGPGTTSPGMSQTRPMHGIFNHPTFQQAGDLCQHGEGQRGCRRLGAAVRQSLHNQCNYDVTRDGRFAFSQSGWAAGLFLFFVVGFIAIDCWQMTFRKITLTYNPGMLLLLDCKAELVARYGVESLSYGDVVGGCC